MKIKAKITKEEIRKKEFLRLKKRDASSINRRCRRRWCTISFPLFSYIIIIFLFLFEEEGGGRRVVGSFFRYDPSRDTTGVTFTVSRVAIVASKKNRRREIYCSEWNAHESWQSNTIRRTGLFYFFRPAAVATLATRKEPTAIYDPFRFRSQRKYVNLNWLFTEDTRPHSTRSSNRKLTFPSFRSFCSLQKERKLKYHVILL